jgi:Ca-activated chloride channel homolog
MRFAALFAAAAILTVFLVGCSGSPVSRDAAEQAEATKPADAPVTTAAPEPVRAPATESARQQEAPGATESLVTVVEREKAPVSILGDSDASTETFRTTSGSRAGADKASRLSRGTLALDLRQRNAPSAGAAGGIATMQFSLAQIAPESRESYELIEDNAFRSPTDHPLSTFSIDVGTASYSNVRRFITSGATPPMDAVRVEEMINYFRYDYPQPDGDDPFAVYTEVGDAPWRPEHRLVHIGLQGRRVDHGDRPASNLVFLMDVSGSMRPPNKLPLLKQAFRLLVGELDERDRVAIVTYAGQAGVALEPTSGAEKREILEVVAGLGAGGSTAGAQGIKTAYDLARRSFIPGGINRVILATDGDFNVGISDDGALVRMIEEKRESGVFLTVLGFGEGNLQDQKMHKLADKGNGAYHYIDSIFEAKKVLIDEMGATLQTIAKDVKIQVEFNPAHVAAYRLVGYETRLLAAEDFADDKKDAGELGAGHTVTALYEVIPRGAKSSELEGLDIPLKYQDQDLSDAAQDSGELLTVKLRYKQPDGDESQLISRAVGASSQAGDLTDGFRFSAAVALFGMLLRESDASGDATIDDAVKLARGAVGSDEEGYRRAFVDMAEIYGKLAATELN